jgi:hypothetical protein
VNNLYNYNPYIFNNNSFVGYYVNDYNEVLNTAVPSNGDAVLFANLDSGMIWAKKIVNNIPTVQPYSITPIFQEASRPQTPVNNNQEILDMLKSLTAEVEKLKGETNESK